MKKKVLGMKQKREHSRVAHLGCKQGGLKWRVLILGGEDVVVDCEFNLGKQKKHHNWKEKGTQFQPKNKFSQPVNTEGLNGL